MRVLYVIEGLSIKIEKKKYKYINVNVCNFFFKLMTSQMASSLKRHLKFTFVAAAGRSSYTDPQFFPNRVFCH